MDDGGAGMGVMACEILVGACGVMIRGEIGPCGDGEVEPRVGEQVAGGVGV